MVADVLRITAILAVVIIHTTTRTLEASHYELLKIPFTLFLNQIFRFAVPLFFIISGFLLELNHHKNENYFVYFKKRVNRIFIPYIFWTCIYYFLVYPLNRDPNFINSIFRGDASYQLYFIPSLIIFYLLFPFISKYYKIFCNKWLIIFLGLLEILLLYLDYNVKPFYLYLPLRVAVLNYFFFLSGMVVSRNFDRFTNFIKRWNKLLLSGSLIFAVTIFFEGLSGYLKTKNYLTFYSSWRPTVFVYSFFIGSFLYWFYDKISFGNIIKEISKLSFFVFFIHVIILEALWKTIGIKLFEISNGSIAQNIFYDPSYFLLVSVISFAIAYLVHKIPFVSKITG